MAKILVIEDYPSLAQAIARTLRRAQHTVTVAMSVREARLLEESFDLATVDIELPDGTGLSAIMPFIETSRVKEVVFFSACRDPDVLVRAAALGWVVDKGAGIPKLVGVVTQLLEGHKFRVAMAVGQGAVPVIEDAHRSGARRIRR